MDILNPRAALAALALTAPTACYEPRLPDCKVECSSRLDCAPEQACGEEGYCVGPDLACSPRERPDAAAAQPDAAPPLQLHVLIDDHGVVVTRDLGACDSETLQHGDCTFTTTWPGVTLYAVPHVGHKFDMWMSGCTGPTPTCTVELVAPLTEVRARFRAL
ncbi:MAG TPA: hypothetical protein VN253_28365 [Kofleriaceae bacterium]|nr:hypothetical protein [Kofleriaceae bacterium]